MPRAPQTLKAALLLSIDDEEPRLNDENFTALIRLRLGVDDTNSVEHTKNVAINASYISPKIQNNLTEICKNIFQKKIANYMKEAQYFAMLTDESMNISRAELSIRIRDTQIQDNLFVMKELFLCFMNVDSKAGQALADEILNSLRTLAIVAT